MATENPEQYLERLVRQSFPGIRCLRCGADEFLLKFELAPDGQRIIVRESDGSQEFFFGDRVTLICERCGHVETHLKEFLERAAKPIEVSPNG